MANNGVELDREIFSCSICLDLLRSPVTVPCGHSYCMSCIKTHWNGEEQEKKYSCPQCRQTFKPRPALRKNTMLATLVEQLKKTEVPGSPAGHQESSAGPQGSSTGHRGSPTGPQGSPAGPEDVVCDVCSGKKLKAKKSCLVCLVSFCHQHLQPHYNSPAFKKHKLVQPSRQLQENICSRHVEVMKMFCRNCQEFVCRLCTQNQHKNHDAVTVLVERRDRNSECCETKNLIRRRIEDTKEDLKGLQGEVEAIKVSADKAVEESEEIFHQLIRLLQERSRGAKQEIRAQQETEVSRVKALEKVLEQEIPELEKKLTELERLGEIEDHNHFLRNYLSLPAFSLPEYSPRAHVGPVTHFEAVIEAVAEIGETLQEALRDKWTNISPTETLVDDLLPEPQSDQHPGPQPDPQPNPQPNQPLGPQPDPQPGPQPNPQPNQHPGPQPGQQPYQHHPGRHPYHHQFPRPNHHQGPRPGQHPHHQSPRPEQHTLLQSNHHPGQQPGPQAGPQPDQHTWLQPDQQTWLQPDQYTLDPEMWPTLDRQKRPRHDQQVCPRSTQPSDPDYEPWNRNGFLRYSQVITLDPDTANKHLVLSEGDRRVKYVGEDLYSPQSDTLTQWCHVLSKQSLSERCYFEVECRGQEVILALVSRDNGNESLFGPDARGWALGCRSRDFYYSGKTVNFHRPGPWLSRVGVYVNQRKGFLSLYSISKSETMRLLFKIWPPSSKPFYAGLCFFFGGDSAEFVNLNR